MNPWLTCPDCGAMLFVVGGLKLIRLKDGLAVFGILRDHDCENIDANFVMGEHA